MNLEHLDVRIEADGAVAVLQLEHGKANEMGSDQLRDFERLAAWLAEPTAPAALITYSTATSRKGTPIFVAGANVTERVGWNDDDIRQHVRWQRRVLTALRNAPAFHVAVVSGVALGWGTEYLLAADYRIAVPGAVFGLPETGLGILPGAGGTSELARHIGVAHTLRLGMTGERIDHIEAARIGLVQELADSTPLALERARQLAALAATRSPTANAAFKRGVNAAPGRVADERMEIEARAYERCVAAGEAAIGRAHFNDIRKGITPPWGPRRLE